MDDIDVSRREVLSSILAAGAGALTLGTGSTDAKRAERHIVGCESHTATNAAKEKADSVYRMIELGSHPTAVAGVFPEKARKQLRQRRDVDYVEKDITYQAHQVRPWGIDRVDADVAHANGETGGDNTDGEGGADIVIIDSGIDDDHPDLQGTLATPLDDSTNHKAFVKCKGPNCNYDWSDDDNHGTHVGGIANAINNSAGVVGVSTDATLHAAKVLDDAGAGSASDIADAIRWTADNGYDVANLSLGAGNSQTVDKAGKYASDRGVLLVAAAGNEGPCTDCVNYPAAYEEFIAVSATSCDDSLANFSSQGPEVELAGPGENIYSSVIDCYQTLSGTSMAAPHVAGAGAQLMDNGYNNTKARSRLNSTAEDIGLGSNAQGNGLLDVAAALDLDSSDDGTGNGPNCGGGTDFPMVDTLSLSENNEGGSPHADFDASWSVVDEEGDLDAVDLTLTDLHNDETEDSNVVKVKGNCSSGTTKLSAKQEENSTHEYEVKCVVTDGNGNTDSATATEVEDGS